MTFIRKILPLVLLLAMCLGLCTVAASCSSGTDAVTYDADTAVEAWTDLGNYVREQKGVGKGMIMLKDNESIQVFSFLKKSTEGVEEGKEPLYLSAVSISTDQRYSFRLDIIFNETAPETAARRFTTATAAHTLVIAEDTLSIPDYTGVELMSFEQADYPENETVEANEEIPATPSEAFLKETAQNLLNLAIYTLDVYGEKAISHGREDFGFVSYDEKNNPTGQTVDVALSAHSDPRTLMLSAGGVPAEVAEMLTETTDTQAELCTCETQSQTRYCPDCGKKTALYDAIWNCACGYANNLSDFCADCGEARPAPETEPVIEVEDLGPAFSGARISYALRMTLLGLGMVFAVLALLWMVLAIFKSVFGGKSAKEPKAPKEPKRKPAPVVSAAPIAPAVTSTDPDPATVAAITAAIAAMIDSDPALSEQFAGGFRVVSFKKKSGKTSWNH